MKRFPRIVAVVAATALASAAVATPAFAARLAPDADEQDLEVSETGCDAGWQATGLYDNLHTDDVEFVYDEATDSVTVTCTFKGIPGKVKAEKTAGGSEDWHRPGAGTTSDVSPCGLFGPEYESHPDFDWDHGLGADDATLTFTKGSTVVTTCTFDLNG